MSYTEPTLIEARTFEDERGYFSVLFDSTLDFKVMQDNQSYNKVKNVFRGMHWQEMPYAQAKLVRCVKGSVLDVAVDLREGSPTYGEHVAVELTEDNHKQLFIPNGFAHGFVVRLMFGILPDANITGNRRAYA